MSKPPAEPTPKKQRGRPFKPGESGNPKGRPQGARNRELAALDALGGEAAMAVLAATVKAAKGGSIKAAEVILARVWPVRKGRPVSLPGLPTIATPADLAAALGHVAEAVAAGDITPDEAAAMAVVLEGQRRAVETVALAERIARLEDAADERFRG